MADEPQKFDIENPELPKWIKKAALGPGGPFGPRASGGGLRVSRRMGGGPGARRSGGSV